MRISRLPVFLAAMMLAAPASAQSFLGEWKATATTPGGDVSETLTISESDQGYAISGVPDEPVPGAPAAGPGTDIVLDGDSFFYKRAVATTTGEIVLTYSGVVSEDTFKGTVEIGGFANVSFPYTGVRTNQGD